MMLVQRKITNLLEEFNISGIILPQEPLWRHSTLLIGGCADMYAVPGDEHDLRTLLAVCASEKLDYFVLGGGSNILVADGGIRDLVIDTGSFNEYSFENDVLVIGAGMNVSTAAWTTGSNAWEGLDFLFGMPGSIGGALWMNARCYDAEIADVLEWVDVMKPDGQIRRIPFHSSQWSYKVSPFQAGQDVILRGGFKVSPGSATSLRKKMLDHYFDRKDKGHYRAPCAGSAFKNNRAFGSPAGKIIERCGLKGFTIGRAAVSAWHANIFVNLGGATAMEFRRLIDEVAREVESRTGFRLEAEILYAGMN